MGDEIERTMKSEVVLKAVQRTLPGFGESLETIVWKSPFFFVQAADTQLGMIVNYGDGSISDQYPNVSWEEEIKLCRLSVEKLNAMTPKPAFFIVCGDLVDAMPDIWPQLRKEQEKDFLDVYKELDPSIPLLCVCGNHDVGNRPTKETIEGYRSTFGDDYFSFWHSGVHFIVLNSQFYEDCSLTKDLAREQDEWLEVQLAKKATHKIIFQHIPWFLKDPNETKEYFNIDVNMRKTMLKKFRQHGVSKIFCGHYHRNAGGWDGQLELVVTSAIGCQLGQDLHGMRLVTITESEVKHAYHSLDNFPSNNILREA